MRSPGSKSLNLKIKLQITVQIEPQKGNNRYLIARRRSAIYRTRYNIHNNFTVVAHGTTKVNKSYTTYMWKIATSYVHKELKKNADSQKTPLLYDIIYKIYLIFIF
jgi:hypothetical protein